MGRLGETISFHEVEWVVVNQRGEVEDDDTQSSQGDLEAPVSSVFDSWQTAMKLAPCWAPQITAKASRTRSRMD